MKLAKSFFYGMVGLVIVLSVIYGMMNLFIKIADYIHQNRLGQEALVFLITITLVVSAWGTAYEVMYGKRGGS